MYDIKTKFIPATGTSGQKVKAVAHRVFHLPDGFNQSVTVHWQHALSVEQNHYEALSRLLNQWEKADDRGIDFNIDLISAYSPRRYDYADIERGYLWHTVGFETRGEQIHRMLTKGESSVR